MLIIMMLLPHKTNSSNHLIWQWLASWLQAIKIQFLCGKHLEMSSWFYLFFLGCVSLQVGNKDTILSLQLTKCNISLFYDSLAILLVVVLYFLQCCYSFVSSGLYSISTTPFPSFSVGGSFLRLSPTLKIVIAFLLHLMLVGYASTDGVQYSSLVTFSSSSCFMLITDLTDEGMHESME